MKKLSKREGMTFLPLIWTVFLYANSEEFVNPFNHRKIRRRCLFSKKNKKLQVFIHLTDKEAKYFDLDPLPEKIFLYGAYNQISVCQMRSKGTIRRMNNQEKEFFLENMKRRFSKEKNKVLGFKIDREEKEEGKLSLKGGHFLFFEPLDFAYSTYERG